MERDLQGDENDDENEDVGSEKVHQDSNELDDENDEDENDDDEDYEKESVLDGDDGGKEQDVEDLQRGLHDILTKHEKVENKNQVHKSPTNRDSEKPIGTKKKKEEQT